MPYHQNPKFPSYPMSGVTVSNSPPTSSWCLSPSPGTPSTVPPTTSTTATSTSPPSFQTNPHAAMGMWLRCGNRTLHLGSPSTSSWVVPTANAIVWLTCTCCLLHQLWESRGAQVQGRREFLVFCLNCVCSLWVLPCVSQPLRTAAQLWCILNNSTCSIFNYDIASLPAVICVNVCTMTV